MVCSKRRKPNTRWTHSLRASWCVFVIAAFCFFLILLVRSFVCFFFFCRMRVTMHYSIDSFLPLLCLSSSLLWFSLFQLRVCVHNSLAICTHHNNHFICGAFFSRVCLFYARKTITFTRCAHRFGSVQCIYTIVCAHCAPCSLDVCLLYRVLVLCLCSITQNHRTVKSKTNPHSLYDAMVHTNNATWRAVALKFTLVDVQFFFGWFCRFRFSPFILPVHYRWFLERVRVYMLFIYSVDANAI